MRRRLVATTGAPYVRVQDAINAAQKGVLHVPNPRWRPVGVIPASGVLTRSYKLPDLPLADPGAIFIVQARFTNSGSGAVQLSNPHVLVEVDSTY